MYTHVPTYILSVTGSTVHAYTHTYVRTGFMYEHHNDHRCLSPFPPLPHPPRLTMQVEEVGPMEIKILELQKSISDSADSCMQMEQHWLRQQSELVRKTREADQQGRAVEKLSRELLILGQKRLRLDGEGRGGGVGEGPEDGEGRGSGVGSRGW